MHSCEALIVRSEANRRWGRLPDAVADLDKALSLATSWRYRFGVAAAYRQRARILADQGRAAAAAEAQAAADRAYVEVTGYFRDALVELLLADPATTTPV